MCARVCVFALLVQVLQQLLVGAQESVQGFHCEDVTRRGGSFRVREHDAAPLRDVLLDLIVFLWLRCVCVCACDCVCARERKFSEQLHKLVKSK